MDEINLIDIYRNLHPNTKSFTYESKALRLKSRIDFILLSRAFADDVQNAEIRVSVAPDNKATFVKHKRQKRSCERSWYVEIQQLTS